MNYAYSNGRKYIFSQVSSNGELIDIREVKGVTVVLKDNGDIVEIKVPDNAPQPVVYGVIEYPISIYPLEDGWYADVYNVAQDKITIKQPWVSYSENNYREANIVYAETFPKVFQPSIDPKEVRLHKIKDKK